MVKEIKILGLDTVSCGFRQTEKEKRENLEKLLNEYLEQGYERKETVQINEFTFWIYLEREKKEKVEYKEKLKEHRKIPHSMGGWPDLY